MQASLVSPLASSTTSNTLVFSSTSGKDYIALPASSLLWVQASRNYVEFCWECEGSTRTTLLRTTFDTVKQQLPLGFMQTHRSYAFQTDRLKGVERRPVGYALQVGDSKEPVLVSRGYAPRVLDFIRQEYPHLRP